MQGHLAHPLARSSASRSEEHTSELQSHSDLVCRLLLEKNEYCDRGRTILIYAAIRHCNAQTRLLAELAGMNKDLAQPIISDIEGFTGDVVGHPPDYTST